MLLVTRPNPVALETKTDLVNLGFRVHVEPMLNIIPISFNYTQQFHEMIIITSINAIDALNKIFPDKSRRNCHTIAAVGEKTVAAIKNCGFCKVWPAAHNVKQLIQNVLDNYPKNTKILYLRGKTITQDLSILKQSGYVIGELIVYEAAPSLHLSLKTQKLLLNNEVKGITFYSAQTAITFINLVTKNNLLSTLHTKIAFCFSKNIADELNHNAWQDIIFSHTPSHEHMIDGIVNYYKIHSTH